MQLSGWRLTRVARLCVVRLGRVKLFCEDLIVKVDSLVALLFLNSHYARMVNIG